ncbi:DUF1697 domain-containing protein [Metabacillus sp. RGM 3146]|uniref:DUF1697 domain-containing protein n=1 Tax=Metabacillus sp. RGM 3146 TaxID=3401092 RepID=UPI003B9A4ABC
MALYIALLRGINVGGKNKIKMAELRKIVEEAGLSSVQTYIQSGNVLFESTDNEQSVREKMQQAIEAAFGFSVTVILRTAEEIQNTLASCPFSEKEILEAEAASAAESLYLAFLLEEPSEEKVDLLTKIKSEDQYRIEGREIYLLFQNSIRNSKLAASLKKLNVPATVRNWKTVTKLAGMAEAMKE